jgi:NAD(P)H dehydrogenase (quinone)
MSIVVTGATGQLGRLIVAHLINRGVSPAEITAAGRDTARLADLASTGVNTAVIDYTDPTSLSAAFTGADVLMLVSGSETGRRVTQHGNAITAAVDAGVSRIVYTSAPQADTSALVLAPEHKATEEALHASGIPVTILRNNWYTENYAAAVQQARDSGVYLTSTGGGRVASASRTDYAEAAAVVITTPGHENATYELAGDVAWNGEEMAEALTEVVSRPVVFTSVSPEEHTAILTDAGLDAGTAGFVVALDGNIRDGLLAGGETELSTLIGRPTTPLIDGLRAIA